MQKELRKQIDKVSLHQKENAKRKKDTANRAKLRADIQTRALDNIARHFLANQEIIKKLNLQQSLLRAEIIKRAKDKSRTWTTDFYQVELAVSTRECLESKAVVQAALGRALLQKKGLLKLTKVREISVTDLRPKKRK